MLTYNNDADFKKLIVDEMKRHKELDQFKKGTYSSNDVSIFKGCSVGCTIDSINKILGKKYLYFSHKDVAETLGIPLWLVLLQDSMFENLPDEKGAEFSVEFLDAIPVGVDIDSIKYKFQLFVLNEYLNIVLNLKNLEKKLQKKVVDAVKNVINLYNLIIEDIFAEVTRAAGDTVWMATCTFWGDARAVWAAAGATRAARSAEAARVTEAEKGAAWAARSVEATEAARAAEAAQATWSARSAESAAWQRYADEVLRLLNTEALERNIDNVSIA